MAEVSLDYLPYFRRRVWPNFRSGCWLWVDGYLDPKIERGNFHQQGKNEEPSRFAYRAYNGQIPPGLCVRHTCDNPICVNPDHLILGTHQENMADRDARNRTLVGEVHSSSVLKDYQIDEIRRIYAEGATTQYRLADLYGVTQGHISEIVNRKKRSKSAAGTIYSRRLQCQ